MLFKYSELRKCNLQYKINHHCGLIFKIGETVFLKSNPEIPMRVDKVEVSKVHVSWEAVGTRDRQKTTFPPECLLHYKDAGLLVYNDEFDVCLN